MKINKVNIGIIAAAVLLGLGFVCPALGTFTKEGMRCLFLVTAVLVLWVTEAMPLGISALVLVAMIPTYGIMSPNDTFASFISSVFFFVLATYSISIAIMKTPLAKRISKFFLKWAGADINKILLGFMIGSAFMSAVMSNVPVTALFMGISLGILDELGAKPRESNIGKSMMIGIPFAAMAGGMATPAGSSINVLALSLYEQATGQTIRFVDWIVIGVPLCIVFVPITWLVLIKMFPPEDVSVDFVDKLVDKLEVPNKLTKDEIKVISIISGMVILWVLSSWIPAINITVVAIFGLIVFCLPGIKMFTWKEFSNEVSWDALIVVGSVTAMGSAVVQSGLADWIVLNVLNPVAAYGMIAFIAILSLVVNWIHIPLPIGPSIVAMSLASVVASAEQFGMNPSILVFALAVMASGCYIAPLDAVPLITYTKGYYSFGDMFKSGAVVSTILCLFVTVMVPLLGKLVF